MTDSPTATLAAAQDVVAVADLALSRDLLADEVLLLDALLDELHELYSTAAAHQGPRRFLRGLTSVRGLTW